MRGRGGRGRGRGGIRRAPVPTSKIHTELKPWTEDDQKDMLSKLLEFMRPSNLSSSRKKDAVELYYITDLIPFIISRIAKLATKPASRDQLHATIKKSLQDDPCSANSPPVDVLYIFSKLLAEGLISISIKQEVCFYNPPLPQYTNPRHIQVVERPKSAPYEADQDLTWNIHQSWYERQKSWRGIQQNYLTKNTDKIDKLPQYQTLQSHYARVCKWIENITQKQLDSYKESIGENNNSSGAFGVEFHTHNTPWKFLETLINLFRVSRKIDDKLVDEIIQSLEENGRLKIDNNQVTYLNKVVPTGPSVPPIAPAITSIFASTPSHFYQYNRITVKDETQNVSYLLPVLAKIGNPDTTFYIFSQEAPTSPVKAETPKEQPAAVEAKKVEQQQTKSWATPTVQSPVTVPPEPVESKPIATPSTPSEHAPSSAPPVQAAKPSWASISSKAASLPQAQPQPPKPQPQTKQPTQQPTKKSQQPAKKSSNPPNKKKY